MADDELGGGFSLPGLPPFQAGVATVGAPQPLCTKRPPVPIDVSNLRAFGNSGKASLLFAGGFPAAVRRMGVEVPDPATEGREPEGAEADDEAIGCEPPIHIGVVLALPLVLALGRAGKATEEDIPGLLLDADGLAHWMLLGPAATGAGVEPGTALPLRVVLFFSFNTRVVCFSRAAAPAPEPGCNVGPALAAFAQPELDVVAPCIPPKPGSEG